MSDVYVSDAVKYIGVDDKTIDLFESQYVVPNGVSYNSYVILDEKIAIMDTIARKYKTGRTFKHDSEQSFVQNLQEILSNYHCLHRLYL